MARTLPLKVVQVPPVNGQDQANDFSYAEMMKAMLRMPGSSAQGLSFDEVLKSVEALKTLEDAMKAGESHVTFPDDQWQTLRDRLDKFTFLIADPAIAEFGLLIRNAPEAGLKTH
jgi:hypothetical protein